MARRANAELALSGSCEWYTCTCALVELKKGKEKGKSRWKWVWWSQTGERERSRPGAWVLFPPSTSLAARPKRFREYDYYYYALNQNLMPECLVFYSCCSFLHAIFTSQLFHCILHCIATACLPLYSIYYYCVLFVMRVESSAAGSWHGLALDFCGTSWPRNFYAMPGTDTQSPNLLLCCRGAIRLQLRHCTKDSDLGPWNVVDNWRQRNKSKEGIQSDTLRLRLWLRDKLIRSAFLRNDETIR